MPASPIRAQVGQVFVPVRDLEVSARWYADLLGVHIGAPSHGNTIVDVPTEVGPGLALDANRPDFIADGPPRFLFWTDDMTGTVEHLRGLGTRITSDVEDIGSVLFVQFEDPDGNPLMVCQRAR